MSGIERGDDLMTTAYVHVEVKGSLDIPLKLGLLADLGDPVMEQEIIKEAVRIAVSERLGYFDGVEVSLSSSGGLEGAGAHAAQKARQRGAQIQQQEEEITASSHSHYAHNGLRGRYCEATVNLSELGRCIEMIQKAYEGLLKHAQLLSELLQIESAEALPGEATVTAPRMTTPPPPPPSSVTTPAATLTSEPLSSQDLDENANAAKILAAARHLVSKMLADHRSDVVAEAASLHACASSSRLPSHEEDMLAEERAETAASGRARGYDQWPTYYHERNGVEGMGRGDDDVDAELRLGLLAKDDRDAQEPQQSQVGDNEDEEALRARYLELGYSPL
ncbi:hypothetical protein JKF63_05101 [Porcisia hertigi]|uniref:Uncharacterized protein n=1 Tax=Porcisia hertigi TaxID=2761500 RepID=A0A836IW46_9TRYP|nr:hypothetical protein JKF63_05101 [Porcisia hertigi]